MRPEWNCVVDWTRSCRACSAPSPHQCPYAYLLDEDELAEIGRISARRAAAASASTDTLAPGLSLSRSAPVRPASGPCPTG